MAPMRPRRPEVPPGPCESHCCKNAARAGRRYCGDHDTVRATTAGGQTLETRQPQPDRQRDDDIDDEVEPG